MKEGLEERLRRMGKMNYDLKAENSEVQMLNDEVIKGRIKEANENFIVLKNVVDGKDEIIFCHAIAKIK